MYVAQFESTTKHGIPFSLQKLRRGDRVITYNSKMGTVVRLEKDEYGEYFIVQLDVMAGEYAYEARDLRKLQ
ncbi:hypothetical protein Desdi_2082 [Desulfitobacterium dichloroeliminans LMG P-21439]|uniref:Uncharacterized protein n=1 Tax=Desulfitobacterium dichloroeliminans (strain LMG P-21439 / DCA1) TaxID=871963 RepID=L0F951_DESDL|nr:hypothetical protein [Desulfitobacterium dichloroeliminans]AGA69525.1 hypothetical protein Desdi_2082 [Desulfitobacterium dichloroeliminans LMG P-21439]